MGYVYFINDNGEIIERYGSETCRIIDECIKLSISIRYLNITGFDGTNRISV